MKSKELEFNPNKLEIVYLPTDSLVPSDQNPKKHPDIQIQRIKASIQEFGYADPIIIGRNNVILAGHARLIAAKELGMETVPTVFINLPPRKAKAFLLANNRLAELGITDELIVAEILNELTAMPDFNIEAVGFSIEEADFFKNIDTDYSFGTSGSQTGLPLHNDQSNKEGTAYPSEETPTDMADVETLQGQRVGMSWAVHVTFETRDEAEAFLCYIKAPERQIKPGKISIMVYGSELPFLQSLEVDHEEEEIPELED